MKWIFEMSDDPINDEYPITANQIFENGIKKGPFYFSIADFITALSAEDEVAHLDNGMRNMKISPSLPFGTVRYSINDTGDRYVITMEIPKNEFDIQYEEDAIFYNIGFPRMVIQHNIRKQHDKFGVIDTKIFALLDDNQAITDSTELYYFPYPNVYTDGKICWGTNERLTMDDLTELDKVFRFFISAPFNEDLGVYTTLGIPSFKKLIEQVKDNPFNDEWLIPTNKNISDLF